MKKSKIISYVMALLICIMSFTSPIVAAEARNTNTTQTVTNFYISDTGVSIVYVDYMGIEGMVTSATITLSIKKRVALFFWSEVASHTFNSTDTDFKATYQHTLDSKGTYKCNVEYAISGVTGVTDIIPFEDTATY
ncbi:MAG: hypothetical protein J6D11_04615 [Clostridia bacterium]|nr:hypothetical protein [Clostridia bacterium]